MPSMRCGHCEELLHYREQIVALRETDTGVVAERETELEAGTVEGAFQPVGKYHLDATKRCGAKRPRTGPSPLSTLRGAISKQPLFVQSGTFSRFAARACHHRAAASVVRCARSRGRGRTGDVTREVASIQARNRLEGT